MPLRVPLQLHPDSRCDALTGIDVEVARSGPRKLKLLFVLGGEPWHVKWPRPEAPARADGLWRHTCLELFVRAGDEEAYLELNLAPSGRWAAYRFARYREGMEIAGEIDEPRMDGEMRREPLGRERRAQLEALGRDTLERYGPSYLTMRAELGLDQAAFLPLDVPWHLGLSAVIEEKSGRLSYWALAFPPGKPDFHHPDCFRLELPAARPA